MSSTPNNNFPKVGDDQLDPWDMRFGADLQYYNVHGIDRPQDIQGMSASNSRQDLSTLGGPVDWNSPDHGGLAPALGRVDDEAEVPSQRPYYRNTQGPENPVDDESFGYQHQHPADQQYLGPYAGQKVDFWSETQVPRHIPTCPLAQGPQDHVEDQAFEYQGQYHAGHPDPTLNPRSLLHDDGVQFQVSNHEGPDPTGPNAASPSTPTINHIVGAQKGSSVHHVGIVASQDNGDGVVQTSTQDAQPVANIQPARRTAKGRTTKKVSDVRRRQVRPGPAAGLTLELYNPVTGVWDPAIRHADIRDQLLQEADAEASLYGGYDFAPAEGENAADRTSFVRAHQSWGPERANRPEVNFIFDRPLRLLPADIQPCSQPESWLWHGYIVLDHADDPMRHFEDCPTVLSSAVEGFRVDAILKRNPAISTLDLWGRLPPQHTKRSALGGAARIKELNTTQAVTNVAWRWRHKACILSWDRRAGWEHTRAFLKEFLTPQQLAQNTTRGREDLTKEELKELEEYVQSAKAAARNKRPVPPAPRRNNVVSAGPTTHSPNADAGQSLPTVGHTQHTHGKPSIQSSSVQKPPENQYLKDCFPSPRGPKHKVETIEEGDWKEAGQEIDDIFGRPSEPSSPGDDDLSRVAKRARLDSIPLGAASRTNRHPDHTAVKSEVNKVTRAPEREAAHANDDTDTAPGHPASTFVDPVDAVQTQDSEYYSNSPEEQYGVAPGYEPVVFPIGSTITVFSPDGVTIQQSVIAATVNTVWKQREIAETIRALQNAEDVTGVNDPTENTSSDASHENPLQALDGIPPEVLDNNHSEISGVGEKQLAPTKEWLFSVPHGTKAFQFPIGDTKVCFMESDMEVRRATLAADGETEWNEISRPEAISILESMQARRQDPNWPSEGSHDQEMAHDIAPPSTPPIIANEDDFFGGNETGANDALSTAPFAAGSPPGTMNPRHCEIHPELEQYGRGDNLSAYGQGSPDPTVHGELEGEGRHLRSPNSQAETQKVFSLAKSAANAIHGNDVKLPPRENHRVAANPHFEPSLRDLIIQGKIRSRSALQQHAYTKYALGEDEMLILVHNKIKIPMGLPEKFEWCKDSKRWVSKPPPQENAGPVRDASPERDGINWENYIEPEYLDETGKPNGVIRFP